MDTEEDLYSGFTLSSCILGISAILSTITHAKLHIGTPPFDGTMHPSAYTDRIASTYGTPPDANGLYDLASPFSFDGIATIEDVWGGELLDGVDRRDVPHGAPVLGGQAHLHR